MTNKDLIMELVNNLGVGAKNAEIIAKILDCDTDGKVCDVVEVKHGEWEYVNQKWEYVNQNMRVCSLCKKVELLMNATVYNYCPNCGADMRERKESKIKKCFDIPKEVAERLLEDTERKETG